MFPFFRYFNINYTLQIYLFKFKTFFILFFIIIFHNQIYLPMSQTLNLNIDEYNPNDPESILPNSPRTLEAMQILGITTQQICYVSKDDFNKSPFPEEEFKERIYEHHCEKRSELIEEIKMKRNEIIKNGGDALGLLINKKNEQTSKVNSSQQNGTSSMVDRERKNLERMKKKQQQEIEQMLEYEMSLQKIRGTNERKLAERKQKEQRRAEE